MTNHQPNDSIERVEEDFDYLAEERFYLPAASEEHCKRLGKRYGKRLVKVVNTKKMPLPLICIFEDIENE